MRPRVFPAEDPTIPGPELAHRVLASMRPRVFPAEDLVRIARTAHYAAASMRPRVFPAEDLVQGVFKAAMAKLQ